MTDFLFRRNTVLEALRGNRRRLYRLWVQQDIRDSEPHLTLAQKRQLPIQRAPKDKLSELAGDDSHQGLVLEAGSFPYSSLDTILQTAEQKNERPFILLLDLLHGPQNIGTLLRTAEACGVHGVIVQDRRAPDITPHVVIYSAGAAEHLHVAQVTNLVKAIEQLKEAEVWVAGLDLDRSAQPLGKVDLNMALGVVVGHEGSGLRRLVRERCDFLVYLPMRGQVASLNAATAGSILLYAARQARD